MIEIPPTWVDRARCTDSDPELWFPLPGRPDVSGDAKAICRGCEVAVECLEWSLVNNEQHGIWGGLSPTQRRRLKRRSA